MDLYTLLLITILALFLLVVVYAIWLRFQLWVQERALSHIAVIQAQRGPSPDGAGGGCLGVLLFLILMFAAVALMVLAGG